MNVVHVVNATGPTSGPTTHAAAIDRLDDVSASVLAWFNEEPHGHDVETTCLDAPGTTIGADIRTLRDAKTYLRRSDIVHTHHPHSATMAKLLCIGGPPVVYTSGTDHRRYTRVGRVANGLTGVLTSASTCVSESARGSRSWWERLLMPSPEVVPTGVDTCRVDRAANLPWPLETEPEGFVVGSAGRLEHVKNYRTLVMAAYHADRRAEPGVSCVIFGSGSKREQLRRLADAIEYDRLYLPGEIPRDEVLAAMHEFDVFSLPSRWEGLSTAVQEAMAAGTPCVLSDIPAFDPFDSVALLNDTGDVMGFADDLVDLVENPGLLGWASERSSQWVRDRYPVERTAEEYRDLYLEIV